MYVSEVMILAQEVPVLKVIDECCSLNSFKSTGPGNWYTCLSTEPLALDSL